MSKKWHAPVYAFFGSVPKIEYIKKRKCHTFMCSAVTCTHEVRRFIGTSDSQSMGNMQRHVRKCWGEDALKKAYDAKTAEGHMSSSEGWASKTGQSLLHLNEVEREKLGTHIDSIPRLKLSEFRDGVRPCTDISLLQGRNCSLGCREPTPISNHG